MGIYTVKGSEEIKATMELYIEKYRRLTGQEPDKEQLKQQLRQIKDRKFKEDFEGIFGTLAPVNLDDAIKCLDEPAEEAKPVTKAKSIKTNKIK